MGSYWINQNGVAAEVDRDECYRELAAKVDAGCEISLKVGPCTWAVAFDPTARTANAAFEVRRNGVCLEAHPSRQLAFLAMLDRARAEHQYPKASGGPVRGPIGRHFLWSLHNLVGHPLAEMAYLVGLSRLSDWLHDVTVPRHPAGKGRG